MIPITGCRKTDGLVNAETKKEVLNAEKFFTEHQSINPAIIAAQQFVKSQNEKYHFVGNLVNKIGLPHWDKSLIFSTDNSPNSITTESGGASSTTVYIPFVATTANEITTSLAINISGSDTLFKFIYDWEYFTHPHGNNNVNDTINTAEEHALLFMQMDKAVFGHTNFVLTDSLLFNHLVPLAPGTNKRKIFLNEGGTGIFAEVWRSGFVDITFANSHCTLVAGYCTPESCDMCSQCVSYSQVEYYVTWWEPDAPSGGNQGGGNQGSGGSSGASNWNPQQECFDDFNTPENECPIGGWVPGSQLTVMQYLSMHLELTEEQVNFLNTNPPFITGIYNYLDQNFSLEAKEKSKEHINKMIVDLTYFVFVNNHLNTGSTTTVWWMDDNWLSNENNFSLGITGVNNQYKQKLTAQEKFWIGIYPLQAYIISRNVNVATTTAEGTNLPQALNGKQDAFRHTFFQAINTRDVPPRPFGMWAATGSEIVRRFGIAHESEVPTQLLIESDMDLFNNEVGIVYCGNCFTTSNSSIKNSILAKLANGELRYLAPLDFAVSPLYDGNNDNTQDCPTCLNGIKSNTILKPTNQ